ncbi:MAG: hypothetical protein HC869_19640 [Rhodospirillales bacterium]|nr:hypothetical protein [Rhodospirillales bacterium]
MIEQSWRLDHAADHVPTDFRRGVVLLVYVIVRRTISLLMQEYMPKELKR